MANRHNHYEAAFESYLRARGVPYVAVDEARRSVLANGGSLKSLDFIVSSQTQLTWLVDVKGRRFPAGEEHKQYWKNWSTADDLRSLLRWQGLFGENFHGLFVFAYDILGDRAPLPAEELFEQRGKLYGFIAVPLAAYIGRARRISRRWDTLAMPSADFRRYARPLGDLLGPAMARAECLPTIDNPS
ncbi:MAG: HYExAFE family protein [Thermoguttaceae bacterium]